MSGLQEIDATAHGYQHTHRGGRGTFPRGPAGVADAEGLADGVETLAGGHSRRGAGWRGALSLVGFQQGT